MAIETVSDLDTFFEVDGGFAIRALIVDLNNASPSTRFARTLPAIFDNVTQAIDAYDDTDIEASAPSFDCKTVDLEGVKRRMTVRFLGLLPGEDGYGKTYEIGTPRRQEVGTSRVYLKETS